MLVAASQTIAVHRQEVGHSRLHPIMGHVNSAPLSTECASERPGIFLSCQRLLGGGQGVVGEGMTSFLLRLGGEFNLNLCLISFDCMRYLISETVAPMSPWSLGRVSLTLTGLLSPADLGWDGGRSRPIRELCLHPSPGCLTDSPCMCTLMHRVLHGLAATLETRQESDPLEAVGKAMVVLRFGWLAEQGTKQPNGHTCGSPNGKGPFVTPMTHQPVNWGGDK